MVSSCTIALTKSVFIGAYLRACLSTVFLAISSKLVLCIDEELSIGDYVLTGGELAAMVVVDAVARLIPGVLGCEESARTESFSSGLLEYPQYTRPREFEGLVVPEELLSGSHARIEAWRFEQSLRITLARRPELLEGYPMDKAQKKIYRRVLEQMREEATEQKDK